MTTSWTIAIDWDRDGEFDGQDDDLTSYVISAAWFLGERTPYQNTADNSTLTLVLNNSDRRFSPENASSSLAGKLTPFKPVRIQSDDGTTVRTHWLGWIEFIQPAVNTYGERTVEITAAGPMQFYKAAETSLALQENMRTDEIVAALIKEVVFPPALVGAWVLGRIGNSEIGVTTRLANVTQYSDLDEGVTVLAIAADNWVQRGGSNDAEKDTFDVYRAVKDVVAAERGRFLFSRDGKALFWNRHRLLTHRSDPATNLLANGDFADGVSPWYTWGATCSVVSGVAHVEKTVSDQGTFCQVREDCNIPPGATLVVSFDLGNSGSQAKDIHVRLHEGIATDWGETFWQPYTIPAGAPLTTYTFSVVPTTRWQVFSFDLWITSGTGDPALLIDNVSIEWQPLSSTITGMTYQYAGLDDFKNEIVVVCHPRAVSASDQDTLWQLEDEVRVGAGKTRTINAKYQDGSDNRIGGKNVTVTDVAFSEGDGSIKLDARANSAEMEITNAGSVDAVLTACTVRGHKITDFGQMEATVKDAASIVDYGRRTMRLNLPSVDNFDDAESIAQFELHRRSLPRGAVQSLSLKSHGTEGSGHHGCQLAWTLGDKIAIQEGQTVHNGSYHIIGEEHKLSAGATLFETTWHLEPAPDSYPWKLGVEGRSELGDTTVLTY